MSTCNITLSTFCSSSFNLHIFLLLISWTFKGHKKSFNSLSVFFIYPMKSSFVDIWSSTQLSFTILTSCLPLFLFTYSGVQVIRLFFIKYVYTFSVGSFFFLPFPQHVTKLSEPISILNLSMMVKIIVNRTQSSVTYIPNL